jgi:hypothetical protein
MNDITINIPNKSYQFKEGDYVWVNNADYKGLGFVDRVSKWDIEKSQYKICIISKTDQKKINESWYAPASAPTAKKIKDINVNVYSTIQGDIQGEISKEIFNMMMHNVYNNEKIYLINTMFSKYEVFKEIEIELMEEKNE